MNHLDAPSEEHQNGMRMEEHEQMMVEEHLSLLWTHFLNILLGLWLISSPFTLDYLSIEVIDPNLARVTAERNLPAMDMRNLTIAYSDVISGILIVIFGALSLAYKHRWALWALTFVGIWLLFAPLVFWTPSAAAYANDTLVGALVIALSVLIPMMPGMSMEGMMGHPDVPPGWDYCPSTWLQRMPIIAMAVIGFLIARYLAAYQLGHISHVWEPFFSAGQGTKIIITSEESKAWPIPDAGLGALSYLLELLMACMGDKRRWRTMPWMVLMFGVLVVPLGTVSIVFIIIQPIMIGTWCTLCLAAALAMLIMIPYTLDELVAMGQFLRHVKRRGDSIWRYLWIGGAMDGGKDDPHQGFSAPAPHMIRETNEGMSFPWTLLLSCGLGVWLMFTRLTFDAEGGMANSDHLVGSLAITTAVIALAEVARPLRFFNVLFGLWLIAAPWIVSGASTAGTWNGVIVGVLLITLSLPKGPVNRRYGGWDSYLI